MLKKYLDDLACWIAIIPISLNVLKWQSFYLELKKKPSEFCLCSCDIIIMGCSF